MYGICSSNGQPSLGPVQQWIGINGNTHGQCFLPQNSFAYMLRYPSPKQYGGLTAHVQPNMGRTNNGINIAALFVSITNN